MMSATRVSGVLLLGVMACSTGESASPSVTDAWIRAAPPTAEMHAGYLVVTNPSARSIRIVGVVSSAFARIEIHRTEIADGVARMLAEPEVDVPARGSAIFEPGGRHLMLFGARHQLTQGETVRLTLEFADATSLEVTAEVRTGADADAHGHH